MGIRMPEVNALKHLPWLILFLLWTGGAALWLLFVNEQQIHLKLGFQSQLDRLGEELLRTRLEGRLGPDSLPEGVRTFGLYGPDGRQIAAWGLNAPDGIEQTSNASIPGGMILSEKEGWIEFLRVLQPLRPRLNFEDEGDWDGRGSEFMGPPPPGPGGEIRQRLQGYLFLRVSDTPLESRLWAWRVGAALGMLAWTGFLAFVGVLWFRARRYQTTLVQHRELLQFAEASRTLSHELRNPLAAILLQTALLKRSSVGEPAAEVAIIEEEARRMSGLVTRVRDFLKDPKGQSESVDLAALASSLRERFAAGVDLLLDRTGPFWVRFDPYRLRSVVENLIKNAVESGPHPSPEVRLSRPRAGWIRLEVLDSGSGFTEESLKQALNPFYTTKTSGTGIGLSIADSFVRAAGGKMRLENRTEGGARVVLDLPETLPENKS
jgi:two-component system sensor histidine kinase HydH